MSSVIPARSHPFAAPAYCDHCGNAFPWTEGRLRAARQLAQEFENISDEDRETLDESIDDLVKDTPMTPVAAETAKKLLWPT